VIVAGALSPLLDTDVAVRVTVPAELALAGEVYVTAAPEGLEVGETVPHSAPLQFAPESDQVTPLFCESFVSVAVNEDVAPPVAMLAVIGETLTTIAAVGVIVMVAVANLVGSDTEVAVSVTVGGVGTFAGAVYVTAAPDALAGATVPHAAPTQPAPDNAHVTPLFAGSFATVAVKLAVEPTVRLAVVCESVTAITWGAAVTVMTAEEVFDPSATEVAVSMMLTGFGTLEGAV
jgi:hypothetical protein